MNPFIQYIVAVSVCITILYLSYRLIFRDNFNPRYARLYLMLSILFSLLIPLSNVRLHTGISFQKEETTLLSMASTTPETPVIPTPLNPAEKTKTLWDILFKIYVVVTLVLAARLLLQILLLSIQYKKSIKVIQKEYTLLYRHRYKTTFSFFRWVFVQSVLLSDDDFDQIIAHEKIHVTQYHSIDLLLIELLSAVMWFNPLVWMMKKSMILVHEYLADRGALEAGIDKIRYQAVLINQVAEERLVCLSSSFNHSIKKRMIMMTKTNIQGRSAYKLIMALPVALILLTAMAVFNGMSNEAIASSGNNSPIGFTPLQDTVTKKSTVKHIHVAHSHDTLAADAEVAHAGTDAEIKHESPDEAGDFKHVENDGHHLKHQTVKHNVKHADVHADGDKDFTMKHQEDSVKHVKDVRQLNDDQQEVWSVTIQHNDKLPDMVYIVDGVEYDKSQIDKMDPKKIVRMDIIKDKDMKKYTTKNVEGVVIITTKK